MAANQAFENLQKKALLVSFRNGAKTASYGQVAAPLVPTGSFPEKARTPLTFTLNSLPKTYAA